MCYFFLHHQSALLRQKKTVITVAFPLSWYDSTEIKLRKTTQMEKLPDRSIIIVYQVKIIDMSAKTKTTSCC